MPKTYTVGGNQGVGGLGGQAGIKIDAVPHPLACGGDALRLNAIEGAVHVQKAGNHSEVDFTDKPAIYTTGLSHCLAVCVAWNKVDDKFQNGYLAHISSPQASLLTTGMAGLPDPRNTPMWVVVSVGAGNWPAQIAQRLVNTFHFAQQQIWIYVRAKDSDTFGIDRFGNFGEV